MCDNNINKKKILILIITIINELNFKKLNHNLILKIASKSNINVDNDSITSLLNTINKLNDTSIIDEAEKHFNTINEIAIQTSFFKNKEVESNYISEKKTIVEVPNKPNDMNNKSKEISEESSLSEDNLPDLFDD